MLIAVALAALLAGALGGILLQRFVLAPQSSPTSGGTWVVPVVAKDEDDANELVDEAKTTAERLGRWPSDADDEYVPDGGSGAPR